MRIGGDFLKATISLNTVLSECYVTRKKGARESRAVSKDSLHAHNDKIIIIRVKVN